MDNKTEIIIKGALWTAIAILIVYLLQMLNHAYQGINPDPDKPATTSQCLKVK